MTTTIAPHTPENSLRTPPRQRAWPVILVMLTISAMAITMALLSDSYRAAHLPPLTDASTCQTVNTDLRLGNTTVVGNYLRGPGAARGLAFGQWAAHDDLAAWSSAFVAECAAYPTANLVNAGQLSLYSLTPAYVAAHS